MNFWRLSAFFVLLMGGVSAQAVRAEGSLLSGPGLGRDMCHVLLARAKSGGYIEGQNALDFIPGVGIGVAGQGIGKELRQRFEALLAEAGKSGTSQQVAVEEYLKTHGYLAAASLGEKHSPPGAADAQSLRLIQEAMASTRMEQLIRAAGKNEKGSSGIGEPQILAALEKIEKGNIVTTEIIAALKALRMRVDGLTTRAQKLRSQADASGQATLLTWEFLRDHDKALRKKISTTPVGKKVYISFPELNKEGELSVSVKAFANLEDYQSFFEQFQRKGESALKYKKNLSEYTRDYMAYRYLTNRFRALDHGSVSFSVTGEKTEAELKEIEDNKNSYAIYVKEISLGSTEAEKHALKQSAEASGVAGSAALLHPKDRIHPHPLTVRREAAVINYVERPSQMIKASYLAFAAVAIVPIFLKNVGSFGTSIVEPVISKYEESHGEDAEYWIERCSKAEDTAALDDCIARFTAASERRTNQKIESKKILNPNYDGNSEKLDLAKLTNQVMTGIYGENAKPQIANASMVALLRSYLGQTAFNQVKLQLHEREEKLKKQAPQNVQPVLSSDTAIGAITPSGLNKANWTSQSMLAEVKVTRESFHQKTLDAKTMMPLLATDISRPAEFADYYTNHITSLWAIGEKLNMMMELEPSDEVKSQINALAELVKAEIVANRNVLAKAMADAVVREAAAAPVPVVSKPFVPAPAPATPVPVVPKNAVQIK